MQQKKKGTLFAVICVVVILLLSGIDVFLKYMYQKNLQIEYLLASRIFDLFFTNMSAIVYIIGLIVYAVICMKFENKLKDNKWLHIGMIVGLMGISIFIANIFQSELYTIDGNHENRFEVIGLLFWDCIEKETETIMVDDFKVEKMSVYFNGGRYSSGHHQKTWYVNINDEYITQISASCVDVLESRSDILGKTEFTVYKNSKIIKEVDGIPLTEYRYSEVERESQFAITMDENGHIDIEQTVILKQLGDISDSCQVCFVKDGRIMGGFGVDDVKNDVRGANSVGEGKFEVYITHCGSICSNIIQYERAGERFRIIE